MLRGSWNFYGFRSRMPLFAFLHSSQVLGPRSRESLIHYSLVHICMACSMLPYSILFFTFVTLNDFD
jgi:hypothetical protein